jgi:hypothetical protein
MLFVPINLFTNLQNLLPSNVAPPRFYIGFISGWNPQPFYDVNNDNY